MSTARDLFEAQRRKKQRTMEKKYTDTTIKASCPKCHTYGDHLFRRWSQAFIGEDKIIYMCNKCGTEMLEDGKSVGFWT